MARFEFDRLQKRLIWRAGFTFCVAVGGEAGRNCFLRREGMRYP
jgi:hypothetical protein